MFSESSYVNSNNVCRNLPPLPFGQLEIVVAAVTLIPMCVFGTIANVCTIAAVLHSNKLKYVGDKLALHRPINGKKFCS